MYGREGCIIDQFIDIRREDAWTEIISTCLMCVYVIEDFCLKLWPAALADSTFYLSLLSAI